ncbi:Ribosome-binding ATPase YchF [Picochlorum sp. SENEW3]|nr:Ribosome-binding ATPase YchF [Picochlorum sp. SENEW3]
MVLSGAMHAGNTKLLRASRFPVCSGLRRLSLMSAPSRAHGSSYSKSLPMRDVSFTGRAIDQSSASVRIGGARGFRTSVVTAALKNGIVGLPNVGKSTMFNAICENGKAQAANFPFCTIEPNVGMVAVPDPRLDALAEIANSQRTVPTSVEFVDIAGLVKGASKGEGLGNQFLANIRECDSIVQVVRCFDNDDVVHVAGKVDPLEDTDVINFELALSDVAQIEKRMEKLKKGRAPKPEEKKQNEMEAAALQKILDALEQGLPARSVELNEDEESLVKVLCLLTKKPMIYAANVGEEDLANQGADNVHVQALKKKAAAEGSDVVVVSAQVEAELNELEPAEAAEYLNDLGVEEGGLKSLIRATYKQLGLLTYFTTGEQETRAWTVRMGSTAPQAAGVIHTDFEKGFIRAETVAYDDYISAGGFSGAKEKGVLRLEGKEYLVNEGDILTFRFAN